MRWNLFLAFLAFSFLVASGISLEAKGYRYHKPKTSSGRRHKY